MRTYLVNKAKRIFRSSVARSKITEMYLKCVYVCIYTCMYIYVYLYMHILCVIYAHLYVCIFSTSVLQPSQEWKHIYHNTVFVYKYLYMYLHSPVISTTCLNHIINTIFEIFMKEKCKWLKMDPIYQIPCNYYFRNYSIHGIFPKNFRSVT